MRQIVSPLDGFRSPFGPRRMLPTASLFALGEPGIWLDPSDLTTLFTDTAGTTPVTAPGQSVGLALDKSKGLVLGSELVTNGDFSGGTTGWSIGPALTYSMVSGEVQVTFAGSAALSGNNWFSQASLLTSTTATYKVTFEATWVSGGVLQVASGFDVQTTISANAGKTSYTVYIKRGTSGTAANQQTFVFAGAAGAVWKIDNISVKALPGNHATQATAASRPTYGIVPSTGRRNLLTYTEQFDNAAWVKSGLNTTATPPYTNVAVSPDGTQNADFMVEDTANSQHNVRLSASMATSTAHTYSFYVKAAGRSSLTVNRFNSAVVPSFTHTFTLSGSGSSSGGAITAVGNDWYRCSGSFTTVGAGVGGFIILLSDGSSTTYTGNGTSGIYLWGAQLETGSTASTYQKVVSQYEVTDPVGFPSYSLHYLQFDGVDDFLVTPTITPGTDKVQVFAGVRKLSDAARGVVVDMGAANNGFFNIEAPSGAGLTDFIIRSIGTVAANAQAAGFPAPTSAVVAGLGDISGDNATLRVNGTQAAQSTTDQGTGNYLAYPLYIGRRGGTTLPFNGQLFGLVTRFGANLDTTVIQQNEAWMNTKTGSY